MKAIEWEIIERKAIEWGAIEWDTVRIGALRTTLMGILILIFNLEALWVILMGFV